MNQSTLEILLARRGDLIRMVAAEADRAERKKLVDELNRTLVALDAITEDKPSKVAPIERIVSYLRAAGGSATQDEIIDAIGGAKSKETTKARNRVFWSLRIHLNGTGKGKGIIRLNGELVELGPGAEVHYPRNIDEYDQR